MLHILIFACVLGQVPDLNCHYSVVNGKRKLVVSSQQWQGIRRALYRLDRQLLGKLISEDHGVDVTLHWMFSRSHTNGKRKLEPYAETTHLPKARFLHIGSNEDYSVDGSGAVSTAEKGDTLYFKWLWVDLAEITSGRKIEREGRKPFERSAGPDKWEIYGWSQEKPSKPSSIITFGSEHGHLIMTKIEASAEPD